eukprot:Skav227200  [mRNA]  locus=scaffold2048:226653:227540:+ [translate_table: standard]
MFQAVSMQVQKVPISLSPAMQQHLLEARAVFKRWGNGAATLPHVMTWLSQPKIAPT